MIGTLSASLLSKELLVAREIALCERDDAPAYFNKVSARLECKGLASRGTVSKALDTLIDNGIVQGDWFQTGDGKHLRRLTIAPEAKAFMVAILKAVP